MINKKNIEPIKGEVDIVYIWCDSNKLDYIKNKEFYSKKYNINSFWSETRDHGEIINSIKSVRKYMKFIRNIFICVPKNHRIKGIDEKKYNIKYISNEEILGEENCPNFNSHSLELFTYKIKGLSDYFIQFNDDFFIASEIKLEDFYNFDTRKIKYYYENFLQIGNILSITTQKYIKNLTGEKYYFWPSHSPRMFNKNDIKKIVEENKEVSEYTKKAKFRTNKDFQLVYLYGYYLLSKNKGEFIFLNNLVINKIFIKIKLLFQKIFSEGFFNIFKQIYIQFFYKKKLYKGKKFLKDKTYSLINLTDNYKENKKNIEYAFKNNVKFICLNDSYKTKNKKIIEKINTENYLYFYNKLFKKGKK